MTYGKFLEEYSEKLMQDRAFEWGQKASPADFKLQDKVYGFADMFEDMIFGEGSKTFDFAKCQIKRNDNAEEWEDADHDELLPEELAYFSYGFFTYHVKELGNGIAGQFDGQNFSLTVAPEYTGDDSAILHEMIHLHELVIALLPTFYHDAVLFCLYKDLAKKIDDLDERIEAHGHILNSSAIAKIGGAHDILFLLKSFDLDLRMGYKLGTVFGYGMSDE